MRDKILITTIDVPAGFFDSVEERGVYVGTTSIGLDVDFRPESMKGYDGMVLALWIMKQNGFVSEATPTMKGVNDE